MIHGFYLWLHKERARSIAIIYNAKDISIYENSVRVKSINHEKHVEMFLEVREWTTIWIWVFSGLGKKRKWSS